MLHLRNEFKELVFVIHVPQASQSLLISTFPFRFVEPNGTEVPNREIKLDVTWSYVKRQTTKMKFLPSVFSSLNSRVKVFLLMANSRRHFSIFM